MCGLRCLKCVAAWARARAPSRAPTVRLTVALERGVCRATPGHCHRRYRKAGKQGWCLDRALGKQHTLPACMCTSRPRQARQLGVRTWSAVGPVTLAALGAGESGRLWEGGDAQGHARRCQTQAASPLLCCIWARGDTGRSRLGARAWGNQMDCGRCLAGHEHAWSARPQHQASCAACAHTDCAHAGDAAAVRRGVLGACSLHGS